MGCRLLGLTVDVEALVLNGMAVISTRLGADAIAIAIVRSAIERLRIWILDDARIVSKAPVRLCMISGCLLVG